MKGLVVVTSLAMLATACGAPQSPAGVGVPTGDSTPQRGGTMQFAASLPPNTLYYYEAQGIDASITLGPMFDTLIEYEFKPGVDWQIAHKIAPALAKTWKVVNDTTYEFELRQGAKWHDGPEVTAEDIVFSYETIRNPSRPTLPAGIIKDLDTIQAIDRYNVRLTTKQPSAEFLALVASSSAQLKILPKHVADKGLKFDDVAIGTGPFKLQSFDRIAKTVLVRNDSYWRDGPYVDKVNIIYGLDPSARLASFITRSNDIINVGDEAQFSTIKAQHPDVQYGLAPGDYNYGMYFKLDQPPFNDLRVRRAMHLAVDRTAMKETLSFGKGVINPPGIPAANATFAIPEAELMKLPGFRQPKAADIAEAKRLLAEAGHPNGFKVNLTKNNGIITVGPVAEMLAGQMKAIGIDMNVKGEEPAVWGKSQRDGTYEILMLNIGLKLPDRSLYANFHTRSALNTAPIRDATLDRLVEEQSRELDLEKRKKIILDLQKHLLEQLYHVPTVDLAFYAAWQPYVKHYVFNHGAQPYLPEPQSIWLDQKNIPTGR